MWPARGSFDVLTVATAQRGLPLVTRDRDIGQAGPSR
jgi:hypothetical protein